MRSFPHLRPVLLLCLISSFCGERTQAEVRLRAAWQSFETKALVRSDPQNVTESRKSGSAGVPGKRDVISHASLTPQEALTRTATARSLQETSLLPDGLKVDVLTSNLRTGIYAGSFEIHAKAVLWLEVEVTDFETLDLSIIEESFENQNDYGNYGVQLFYNILSPPGWDGDWSWGRGELSNKTLSPGIYRIFVSVMTDNGYSGNFERHACDTTYELRFSNYVIEPGALQSHPLLPDEDFFFTNVSSRRWFDPPLADGYSFVAQGDTTFEEVVAMPTGFQTTFHVYVGGEKIGEVEGGESFDFREALGGPVAAFEIRNILPLVDAAAPDAFPVMLRFTEETGNFKMTPLEAAIASAKTLPSGDVMVEFQGILQSNSTLDPSSWRDLDPQPPSPLLIPKSTLQTKEFFRARKP